MNDMGHLPHLGCILWVKTKMTMATCNLLEHCPFYNDELDQMPSATDDLKMRYCEGWGHRACARHIILTKMGMERIPDDLLPNQQNRLNEILGFV